MLLILMMDNKYVPYENNIITVLLFIIQKKKYLKKMKYDVA